MGARDVRWEIGCRCSGQRLIVPIELGVEPIDETTAWGGFSRVLVQGCPIALVTVTVAGRVMFANEQAVRLLGSHVATGGFLADFFSTEHAARAIGYLASLASAPAGTSTFFSGELRAQPDDRGPRSNQPPRWVHVYGRNLNGSDPDQSLILALVDATQARQREQDLARRALYDDLTGLPNRTLLAERLQSAWDQRSGTGALMMVDLDGFKLVNDRLGHITGDVLLVEVARRLSQQVPSGSTIARLGGDEFAILLPETTANVAWKVAAAICERVAEPIPELPARITASIGVTELGSLEATLRQADLAMYTAKSAGRNRAVLYGSQDFQAMEATRKDIATGLSALTAERDRLHIEARTDALTGLANRRALDEYMERFVGPLPASVLFIDLDRFSAYNHRHGDQAGDQALRTVAHTLATHCRDQDKVFRKGGEEFTIVLPGLAVEAAQATGERLRAAIEDLALEHHGADDTPVVTVTIGTATRQDDNLAQALSDAADTAFACKIAGLRNRVTTARS